MVDTEKVKLAAEAYIYGYPLVYSAEEIGAFVAGGDRFPMKAPYNTFGHARALAGPEFKFVTPNNDTLYSIAMCDVRQGPLALHVPDTAGRYYVLQFVDAWSNNFAYVGRRATGTVAGDFLLVEAGWDGEAPEGTTVITSPTGVCVIVGRIQVDGEADLSAAHALQDQFTLTPQADAPSAPEGVPAPDPSVGEDLLWWERFRVALQAFPPPSADEPFLKLCEQLGLTAPVTPFAGLDPEQAQILIAGAQAGQAKIEELGKQTKATPAGWQITTHLFDYNLDFYEVGTVDAPQWRIADRTTAYVTRSVVARAGLWGNHGYEADYAIVWVDGDGEPLDGSRRYELHLESPPPVAAFWSLTMYDVPDFYLVENPIKRYSIGDRTPGLQTADDGSITLYLQHESPGADKEANWLPAPAGAFRPVLRMYQPEQAVLDETYVLPAIRRVG